mgnify:FL=1
MDDKNNLTLAMQLEKLANWIKENPVSSDKIPLILCFERANKAIMDLKQKYTTPWPHPRTNKEGLEKSI